MKTKINVGFSTTIQARQFHPITTTDSIEMEIEVNNDEELMEKYEYYQNLLREKVIKNTVKGVKDFINARDEMIEDLENE